jgi:hypothetical protein
MQSSMGASRMGSEGGCETRQGEVGYGEHASFAQLSSRRYYFIVLKIAICNVMQC